MGQHKVPRDQPKGDAYKGSRLHHSQGGRIWDSKKLGTLTDEKILQLMRENAAAFREKGDGTQ